MKATTDSIAVGLILWQLLLAFPILAQVEEISNQSTELNYRNDHSLRTDTVSTIKHSLEAGMRYEHFESAYSKRLFTYLQYGVKFNRTDVFFKGLRYDLGLNTGYQFSGEAYLKFKRKGYGYMEMAYSDAEILPNYRLRAEVFRNSGILEYSLGLGLVKPHQFREIPLLTGTLGVYFSDYFIYARPTISYIDNGYTKSIFIQGRRYLNKNDFIALSFLKGADTGTSRNINAIANTFGADTYLVRINGQVKRGRYKLALGLDYGGIYIPERTEYAKFIGFDILINREF